jgi:hypothetical protein
LPLNGWLIDALLAGGLPSLAEPVTTEVIRTG